MVRRGRGEVLCYNIADNEDGKSEMEGETDKKFQQNLGTANGEK